LPHQIQPASSGRSKCRGCGKPIAAGELRFGENLPNPFAEGDMTQWFHLACGAYKRPEAFLETVEALTEPLPDGERLSAEAKRGTAHHRLPRINGAERAPSGRAQCRHCRATIDKGAWRIPLVFFEEGRFEAAGSIHVRCAQPYFETADVLPRVKHFAPDLTEADLREIEAELQQAPPPA
jgi:poly(ADP-ribose) polymerase-like protein